MSGGNRSRHTRKPGLLWGLRKKVSARAIEAVEYIAADCTMASATFWKILSRADNGVYRFVLRSTRQIMRTENREVSGLQ